MKRQQGVEVPPEGLGIVHSTLVVGLRCCCWLKCQEGSFWENHFGPEFTLCPVAFSLHAISGLSMHLDYADDTSYDASKAPTEWLSVLVRREANKFRGCHFICPTRQGNGATAAVEQKIRCTKRTKNETSSSIMLWRNREKESRSFLTFFSACRMWLPTHRGQSN